MSKIRKLQNERKTLKDAIGISKILLNLAFSNIAFSRSKYENLEKRLVILEEIIVNYGLKVKGEKIFTCFSDGSFASRFNSHSKIEGKLLGKNSRKFGNIAPESLTKLVKSPEKLLEDTEHLTNLRFFIKDYKTDKLEEISIEKRLDRTKKSEMFFDESNIEKVVSEYMKQFIKFCLFKAIHSENQYRSKIMNGALENSSVLYKKMTSGFNKLRQEIITSEIGNISTVIGVNND